MEQIQWFRTLVTRATYLGQISTICRNFGKHRFISISMSSGSGSLDRIRSKDSMPIMLCRRRQFWRKWQTCGNVRPPSDTRHVDTDETSTTDRFSGSDLDVSQQTHRWLDVELLFIHTYKWQLNADDLVRHRSNNTFPFSKPTSKYCLLIVENKQGSLEHRFEVIIPSNGWMKFEA